MRIRWFAPAARTVGNLNRDVPVAATVADRKCRRFILHPDDSSFGLCQPSSLTAWQVAENRNLRRFAGWGLCHREAVGSKYQRFNTSLMRLAILPERPCASISLCAGNRLLLRLHLAATCIPRVIHLYAAGVRRRFHFATYRGRGLVIAPSHSAQPGIYNSDFDGIESVRVVTCI